MYLVLKSVYVPVGFQWKGGKMEWWGLKGLFGIYLFMPQIVETD